MENPSRDSFDVAASQAAIDAGIAPAAAPPPKSTGGRPRRDGLTPGSPEAKAADRKKGKAVSDRHAGASSSSSSSSRRPDPEPEPIDYPEPTEQDVAAAKPIAAAVLIPLASIDGAAITDAEVDAMAEPIAATLRYYLGDGPAHPLARVGVAAALISLPRVVHWYEQRQAEKPTDPVRDEAPTSFSSAVGGRALASV